MQSIIVGKSEKCDGLGFRTQAGLVRRVFLELEMVMLQWGAMKRLVHFGRYELDADWLLKLKYWDH